MLKIKFTVLKKKSTPSQIQFNWMQQNLNLSANKDNAGSFMDADLSYDLTVVS